MSKARAKLNAILGSDDDDDDEGDAVEDHAPAAGAYLSTARVVGTAAGPLKPAGKGFTVPSTGCMRHPAVACAAAHHVARCHAALETQASQMKPAKHADKPEKFKKKKKKESAAKQEAARAQELTSATQSLLRCLPWPSVLCILPVSRGTGRLKYRALRQRSASCRSARDDVAVCFCRAEAEHEGLGAGFTPHIAPFDGVLAKLNRRRQQLTGRPFQPPPPTMPPVATADDILENLDAVMAAALAAGGGGSSGDEGRGGDGSGDDARLLIEDDASEDEAGPSSGTPSLLNSLFNSLFNRLSLLNSLSKVVMHCG